MKHRLPVSSWMLALLVITALSALWSNSYSSAVENEKSDFRGWVDFGFGGSDVGISLGMGLAFQYGHGLLKFRYTDNFLPFVTERTSDTGVLIGVSTLSRYAKASFSMGMAITRVDSSEHLFPDFKREKKSTTIGVPVELSLSLAPLPVIGFGLTVFANYNSRRSFGGLLVNVMLGKLW